MLALATPQALELTGPAACTFAQAQFCNDVDRLLCGTWQWNAWLNPQGRVRAFFLLLRVEEQKLILLLRGGSALDLIKALQPYILRSKLNLNLLEPWQAFGSYGTQQIVEFATTLEITPPSGREIVYHQGIYGLALPGNTARVLWLSNPTSDDKIPITANLDAQKHWYCEDIYAGIPEIGSKLAEQFVPQMLGLERLSAISFGKGCYPGQEVVARLHFKGGNKRHLYRIEVTGDLPQPGLHIYTIDDATTPIGTVLNGAQQNSGSSTFLAVLRDEFALNPLRLPDEATLLKVIPF